MFCRQKRAVVLHLEEIEPPEFRYSIRVTDAIETSECVSLLKCTLQQRGGPDAFVKWEQQSTSVLPPFGYRCDAAEFFFSALCRDLVEADQRMQLVDLFALNRPKPLECLQGLAGEWTLSITCLIHLQPIGPPAYRAPIFLSRGFDLANLRPGAGSADHNLCRVDAPRCKRSIPYPLARTDYPIGLSFDKIPVCIDPLPGSVKQSSHVIRRASDMLRAGG